MRKCDAKSFWIYIYYNKDREPIYVGQATESPIKRFFTHKNNKKDKKLMEETFHIDYAEVSTATDMDIYEIYLMNSLLTKYNKRNQYNQIPDFRLHNLYWIGCNVSEICAYKRAEKDFLIKNPYNIEYRGRSDPWFNFYNKRDYFLINN